MVYDKDGNVLSAIYGEEGGTLALAYDMNGTEIFSGDSGDYNEYSNDYQKAILDARDEWKAQYRADPTVIPLVLTTDEHGYLKPSSINAMRLTYYLGKAIKWNEVSAYVGLGDTTPGTTAELNSVLSYIPVNKRISIWGNHDLWANYTEVDGSFVIDWNTMWFDNSGYGDDSDIYDKKYNEFHVDEAHGIKYVCIAGWEIDKSVGGYSRYIIGSQSMENIIEMLEANDGYDIVILSHCSPFLNCGQTYRYSKPDSDELYDSPQEFVDSPITVGVDTRVGFDEMIEARNNKTSGTIIDTYGVEHFYDFTGCTGNVICTLMGHGHRDTFEYSLDCDILGLMFDAYGYDNHPFYLVNIDRTQGKVNGWKITEDAVYQPYEVPLSRSGLTIVQA